MSRRVSATEFRLFWMRSRSSESMRLRSMVAACRLSSVRNCQTVYAEYTATADSVTPSPASNRNVGVRPRSTANIFSLLPPLAAHSMLASQRLEGYRVACSREVHTESPSCGRPLRVSADQQRLPCGVPLGVAVLHGKRAGAPGGGPAADGCSGARGAAPP